MGENISDDANHIEFVTDMLLIDTKRKTHFYFSSESAK